MATSNLPTPTLQTLQPVTEAQNLLVADEGASCCGGGFCSID